jgi:hypothetical protein
MPWALLRLNGGVLEAGAGVVLVNCPALRGRALVFVPPPTTAAG